MAVLFFCFTALEEDLGACSRGRHRSRRSAKHDGSMRWTRNSWPDGGCLSSVTCGCNCVADLRNGRFFGTHRLWRDGLLGTVTDWNRTAIQRLILDAEGALLQLDDALANGNREEQARAIRNGRRAYKELVWRRRSFLLTPLAATALEQLFAQIRGRVFALREKVLYTRRWA
jgi:hypothetical protein